jgi:hypothetical protein
MGQEYGVDVAGLKASRLQLRQKHPLHAYANVGHYAGVGTGVAQARVDQQRLTLRTDQVAFKVDPKAARSDVGLRVHLLIRRPCFRWHAGESLVKTHGDFRVVEHRNLYVANG